MKLSPYTRTLLEAFRHLAARRGAVVARIAAREIIGRLRAKGYGKWRRRL